MHLGWKRYAEVSHLTLKTYGGRKAIDFGEIESIKLKMKSYITKYWTTIAYLQNVEASGAYRRKKKLFI